MRSLKFELLRPDEINEIKESCPIAYLPVGPLEWHGPHLPVGTDPLNAQAISMRVAEKVGGIVMPTLFFGTERERAPQMLRNIGFTGEEWVIGMDHPKNNMPSLYSPEEVFGIIIREYLRILIKQKFKLILIMNGHGAPNQITALERLALEFTNEADSVVKHFLTFPRTIEEEPMIGHATKTETSIMSYLFSESVDLNTLPQPPRKIYNVDYGIVDGETFAGLSNNDFTVRFDPRDASPEYGKKVIETTAADICKEIKDLLNKNNI